MTSFHYTGSPLGAEDRLLDHDMQGGLIDQIGFVERREVQGGLSAFEKERKKSFKTRMEPSAFVVMSIKA